MPLSRESIKSSSETEEDQSVTIPTSSVTDHFKNRLMHSKRELHDSSNSYLIVIYFPVVNFAIDVVIFLWGFLSGVGYIIY